MNYLDILHAQLRFDEGYRTHPYPDTKGKITIGVGHNLTDNGLTRGQIALIEDDDLADAEHVARLLIPGFDVLSDARKAAVMNMAFAMGYLTLSTFKTTLAAINRGDWEMAAQGIMNSKWAATPGQREERVAELMRTNVWRPM